MPKDLKFLGTTSFIIFDTRVKNVQFLKGKVDIVQLLYLESIFEDLEVKELIRAKKDIEYFIHMPIDIDLKKVTHWDTLNIFAEKLKVLNPQNYIIHAEGSNECNEELVKSCKNRSDIFYEQYIKFVEKFPETLVENIKEIGTFENLSKTGAKICLDIGHAISQNIDIKKFINKYEKNIKAYHLHGVDGKKDHKSVRFLKKDLLKYLLDFAAENDVKIIIEVFGKRDFFDSIKYLRRFFKKYGYAYHRWD